MTTLSLSRALRPAHALPRGRRDQAGIALAVALVILIVITLLGVTAIRRAQLQTRLSQNAEATVAARSTASVNMRAMLASKPELTQVTGGDGFNTCWRSSSTKVPLTAGFTCATVDTAQLASFASTLPGTEQDYSYFMVKRETPSTLPVSTLRSANLSGVAYKFASFSLLSGFDATDSSSKDGAAEVSQTVLQPIANAPGITEQ